MRLSSCSCARRVKLGRWGSFCFLFSMEKISPINKCFVFFNGKRHYIKFFDEEKLWRGGRGVAGTFFLEENWRKIILSPEFWNELKISYQPKFSFGRGTFVSL